MKSYILYKKGCCGKNLCKMFFFFIKKAHLINKVIFTCPVIFTGFQSGDFPEYPVLAAAVAGYTTGCCDPALYVMKM